jgi:arylsulfatase A-like enzyme
MRVPGFPAARVAGRVALVDLVPTLLELIGLEQNAPELDGQSLLVPVSQPRASSAERPIFCAVFQMLSGRQNFFIQSVRTAQHTLVHEMLSDGLELYDTRADPGEHRNLARDPAEQPRLEAMKATLKASLQGNLFEARSFQ